MTWTWMDTTGERRNDGNVFSVVSNNVVSSLLFFIAGILKATLLWHLKREVSYSDECNKVAVCKTSLSFPCFLTGFVFIDTKASKAWCVTWGVLRKHSSSFHDHERLLSFPHGKQMRRLMQAKIKKILSTTTEKSRKDDWNFILEHYSLYILAFVVALGRRKQSKPCNGEKFLKKWNIKEETLHKTFSFPT